MEEKQKGTQYLDVIPEPVLRILLISDSNFLGFFIAKHLLKKEIVEISYLQNKSTSVGELSELSKSKRFKIVRELKEKFDYIFHINLQSVKNQKLSPLDSLKLSGEQQAKYLFATAAMNQFPKSYFLPIAKSKNVDWRLIYFNFVYGSSLEKNTLLEKIFEKVKKGKVVVAAEPEERIYPLYISDFTEGVLRSMFSSESNNQIFYLTGKEKISLADFATRIKTNLKEKSEIIYVAQEKFLGWTVDSTYNQRVKKSWWQLVFKPKIDIDKGIRLTVEALTGKKRPFYRSLIPRLSSLNIFAKAFPEISLKNQKKSLGKVFILIHITYLTALLLMLPFFVSIAKGYLGYRKLEMIENKIIDGDWQDLADESSSAREDFIFSREILWQYSQIFSFLPIGPELEKIEDYLNLSISLTESLKNIDKAMLSANNLREIVFGSATSNPNKEVEQLLLELNKVEESLSFAQLLAEETKTTEIPFMQSLSDKSSELAIVLPEWRQKIAFMKKLVSLSPNFLAFDGRKKYLILLQNNMELRPTGGFIGSYGLLTFEKGHFLDFNVDDVYNADGQLKGHVEPPAPLKEFLGASWYFRDSNFSPNFPTAANQAEWFLEKETSHTVNGTIGLNLDFIKGILRVIGPVNLPDYNEEITEGNLFERAEYFSEIDFFPGSTQKKSFLTTLSGFLFEELKTVSPKESLDLFAQWYQSIEQKEMMFAFHDTKLQKRIQTLGWSGEVKEISFGKTGQFAGPGLIDYLMIVDANVGVNKANYFIERSITHEATILKEGDVTGKLQITYFNDSQSQSWPGGTYKNYLRVLLPPDVKNIVVKQKKKDDSKYETLASSKISRTQEFDKSIFGFLVNVEPQETRKIVISYQRKEKLPIKETISDYVFYLQKQSGTKDDSLQIKVNYPIFLKPVKIMPTADFEPQNVTFDSSLNKDKLFAIEFSH